MVKDLIEIMKTMDNLGEIPSEAWINDGSEKAITGGCYDLPLLDCANKVPMYVRRPLDISVIEIYGPGSNKPLR